MIQDNWFSKIRQEIFTHIWGRKQAEKKKKQKILLYPSQTFGRDKKVKSYFLVSLDQHRRTHGAMVFLSSQNTDHRVVTSYSWTQIWWWRTGNGRGKLQRKQRRKSRHKFQYVTQEINKQGRCTSVEAAIHLLLGLGWAPLSGAVHDDNNNGTETPIDCSASEHAA